MQADTTELGAGSVAGAVGKPRRLAGKRRLVTLDQLDRRTRASRRARSLAAAFRRALGGELTDAQKLAVQNAAALVAISEDAQARRLAGDPAVTLDDLERTTRMARAAVRDLGLDRKRELKSDHLEPQPRGRFFRVIVRNHMKRDEEVARFRAEHGVTSDDTLWVRCIVPYECRPGETAAEAYQRELREMASKTQEALPDARESARLESAEGGSATEIRREGRPLREL
jgi:hypothetical protein